MGAIMCMGVATANSILVVSLRPRAAGASTATRCAAAIEAGFTRFRPVLMTALAMIIGMVPMALGLGEGGEQNAPLGRAVIGGLLLATVATLVFVPAVFALLHARRAPRPAGARGAHRRRIRSLAVHADGPSAGGVAPPSARRRAPAAARRGADVGWSGWRSRLHCLGGLIYTACASAPRPRRRWPQRPRRRRRRSSTSCIRTATRPTRTLVLPGQTHGLHRHADLCAHQRLPEALEFRHRRPCEARGRCWPRSRRPNSTSSCARRGALARCRRRRPGEQYGPRQGDERPHRGPGAQGWTAGSRRDQDGDYAASSAAVDVARANRAVAQAQVDRLEQLTRLRERVRAVRRRHHRAQHRCRRAHQRRRRQPGDRAVPHGLDRDAAHLRRGARRSTRRRCTPGATATVTLDEYPGAGLPRHARAHRQRDRPHLAHAAGRGGRGQRRRQAAARRLCVRAFHAAGPRRSR